MDPVADCGSGDVVWSGGPRTASLYHVVFFDNPHKFFCPNVYFVAVIVGNVLDIVVANNAEKYLSVVRGQALKSFCCVSAVSPRQLLAVKKSGDKPTKLPNEKFSLFLSPQNS